MLLQNGSTSFRTLGFFNTTGSGRFETEALGISPDGQNVVGYSYDSLGQRTAFSWNIADLNNLSAPLTSLGSLGGTNGLGRTDSVANGVANDGFAAGSSITPQSSPGNTEAFRVHTNGQTPGTALPSYSSFTGGKSSTAFGISAMGTGPGATGPFQYETVVGQARISDTVNSRVATTWRVDRTNGDAVSGPFNLQNFSTGPSDQGSTAITTAARAVTPDGSIAVGFGVDTFNGSNVARQAYWKIDPATGQPTGPAVALPFVNTGISQDGEARAVGADGSAATGFVAVGRSRQNAPNNGQASEATVWSVDAAGNTTFQELGWIGPQGIGGPFSSIADGVSAQTVNRTVVGTSSSSDPLSSSAFREAFIMWLGDSTRPAMVSLKRLLNDTEYHLQIPDTFKLLEATAVSADGNVIVGYGTNQQNQTEAWVVVLATPEPGSFGLLAGAGAMALRRRRRRVSSAA